MTAPSQTPEAAGLEVAGWRFRGHVDSGWIYTGLGGRHEGCEVEPLVTAASAQAAIDAEKARADRLAKALERAADDLRDIGTQKPQPTNSPDPEHENYLRRVLISLGQVGNARARAALQQETQK